MSVWGHMICTECDYPYILYDAISKLPDNWVCQRCCNYEAIIQKHTGTTCENCNSLSQVLLMEKILKENKVFPIDG